MRFTVEPKTGAVKLVAVHAVIATENTDIMLTHASIDLRFQQHSLRKLQFVPSALPKGIREFLAAANLSRARGQGKLETPGKISMLLEKHVCNAEHFGQLGMKDPGDRMFEVEYLFAGMEVRNTLLLDTVDGWRLRYTSVDAGKAIGKRGELALLPVKSLGAIGQDTEEEFIEAAFGVAGVLDKGVVAKVRNYLSGSVKWYHGSRKGKGEKRKFFLEELEVERAEEINEQGAGGSSEEIEELDSEESLEDVESSPSSIEPEVHDILEETLAEDEEVKDMDEK